MMLPIWVSAAIAEGGPATVPAPQIAANRSPSIDAEIAHQLEQLASPDPADRRRASDALVQIGAVARPAVVAASQGDDPQIADAAQQVLRLLPWSVPNDPPDVKQALDSYGQGGVVARIGIVAQLGEKQGSHPALLRLLSDELNDDVCWQIEAQLVGRPDEMTFSAARQLDLQTCRPAAMVLAGRAWLTPLPAGANDSTLVRGANGAVDRQKGLAMLGRAVELEAVTPTNDNGELDFAFEQLAADAVGRNQPEAAAALRRQQCKRIGVTRDNFPSPFFELLILHATFGPLEGFSDDLRAYPSYLMLPESFFILSRLYERQGQSLMAQVMVQAALDASVPNSTPPSETRTQIAGFLMRHGWNDLAAAECRAALSHAPAQPNTDDVNARLMLSDLAAMGDDEEQAAEHMRRALEDCRVCGGDLTISGGTRDLRGEDAMRELQIELAQHRLHAAQAKGDSAEAGRQVDELLRLGPHDEQAALDLVPELKARGRGAEAKQLFESVYLPVKARIDAGEVDPTLMNDMAWLCARCGEHLDEALDLSNRAVAAVPDNPAFLDTNAEAHFRKGQAAEAARLESAALKLQPGDRFMERQLKRFQAGAKGN
jgi:tetratricopeptide (TPR) repeat protein